MAWADELKKLTQGTQKQTDPTRESLLEPKLESGIPTRKPDGSLTDYGKSLIQNEQTQLEASQILSTYKAPEQMQYQNGMYKNYEDYVANSYGSPMSRERFLQSQQEKMAQIAQDERNNRLQDGNGGSYTGTTPNYGGSMGSTGAMSSYDQSSGNLLEQQRQARLNTAKTSLGATRENMLSNLTQKKAEIDPRIAQSRASAVSGTTIAQKRLADLIPFSGTMAGTQVAKGEELNTDLQNRQSALDVEREQSFKDIATQETETERAYQQGLALADSQAQEQYLSEQLANARTQEERAYAQQQLNDQRSYTEKLNADERAYQQQLTQQQQAYQQQQTASQRAYTEQQNKAQQDREDYKSNIGQFRDNYQAEINRLEGRTNATNFGKGNINLNDRPIIKNEDGTISTIRSISINEDGKEVLIPTVRKGLDRIMTDKEAIDWYKKTGEHLGKFNTVEDADSYANSLHEEQSNQYANIDEETQWKISQLKSARAEKIANMSESRQNEYIKSLKSEQEQQEQALELAKWRFNNGLPATQMDAQLLGVKVGQVSPSQAIKNAELQLQKQKESRISSKSSGGSSGGSSSGGSQIAKTSTIKSQIDNNIKTEIETRGLSNTASTLAQLRADQIVKYAENNQLTDNQATELITTYGLTQAQIEQAERRLQLIRGLGGQ